MSQTNSSHLLVPIHIDALVVGSKTPDERNFQWSNVAPDFTSLQRKDRFTYRFSSDLTAPFTKKKSGFMEEGVHLHFRLPSALTHAHDAELRFPRIPNRWLVQRFGGHESMEYGAWLIKSDAAASEGKGVTWPTFHQDKPSEFPRIGTCTEQGESTPFDFPDEPAEVEITAIGPGIPAFSASYPACRSVLGFHDPGEKLPTGISLTYLVTGWYSSEQEDPLFSHLASSSASTAEEQLREIKAWAGQQRWDLDLNPDDELPSHILCHGLVRGINWKGKDTNYWHLKGNARGIEVFPKRASADQKEYELAVGNTSAEALAGLLAEGQVDQDLLSAFQSGRIREGVSLTEVREELHDRRFRSVPGGTTWNIQPEPDHGGSATAPAASTGGTNQVPGPLRELLRDLNDAQVSHDELARKVQGWGRQLHALWYLWSKALNGRKKDAADSLKARFDQLKAFLAGQQQELIRARKRRDACRQRVEVELTRFPKAEPDGLPRGDRSNMDGFAVRAEDTYGATGIEPVRLRLNAETIPGTGVAPSHQVLPGSATRIATGGLLPPGADAVLPVEFTDIEGESVIARAPVGTGEGTQLKYRLAESVALPFYQPNDPVVAVAGPAMKCIRSLPYQRSKPLPCRLSGQVVSGITLQVPAGAVVTVTGHQLHAALRDSGIEIQRGIHGALLEEALLLDQTHAPLIAKTASSRHQSKLHTLVRALQNPGSTSAQKTPAAAPNVLEGTLPASCATFKWKGNPWMPLFLAWRVTWQSDCEDAPLPPEQVMDHWTLAQGDGDGDLSSAGDSTRAGSKAAEYESFSILTPHSCDRLKLELEALDPAHPFIKELENRPVMTQSLGGFTEFLTARQAGLQLPPLDYQKYYSSRGSSLCVSADLPPYLLKDFETAPTPGQPFFPLRSGSLRIQALHIVDAFGQTLKLPVETINADPGKLFHRAHNCVSNSSGDGSAVTLRPRFPEPMRLDFRWEDASAHAGPVCGWVVPNHLEKSLTVYSAAGLPLGILQQKLGLGAGTQTRRFYWADIPGAPDPVLPPDASGTDYDQLLQQGLPRIIGDNHLRHFCTYLLSLDADDGASFSQLVNEALQSADQRVPEEDPGVSLLVGTPLALVRASLRFETPGLPTHRPGVFLDTVPPGASSGAPFEDQLVTHDYEKVKWPLRLGEVGLRNDGLIGLFKCAPGQPDQPESGGAFYPVWGLDDERLAAKDSFARQDFTIDCLHPLQVTLLMDPQARVHATTGALPRANLELPPAAMGGAKRAREVFFQTAPVLGASSTPNMPRPSDDYGEWTWAYRPDVTTWQLDPNLVQSTDRAAFGEGFPSLSEGWLNLRIAPLKVLSFWVREGTDSVAPGTHLHLGWSLQGAESLRLEKVTGDGKTTTLEKEWLAPPFPREFLVTVAASTTYRLTAAAHETAEVSFKELAVHVLDSSSSTSASSSNHT